MSNGINFCSKISKLPNCIIKRSSTGSTNSYLGTENHKITILTDLGHAGTAASPPAPLPWHTHNSSSTQAWEWAPARTLGAKTVKRRNNPL